ncbi:MAG: beta-galactosidase trimerization domain-containing protein [Anaerolineae bacterium]|nr:beta-galactosidase trimerization domain-containing protein [Anaerolineae bacterium]
MVTRKNAFFGIHFDLHAGLRDTELGADITEDNIHRLLNRVKPDFVQQDCKGHPGYTSYPTKVGWSSPGIQKDALAIWRKVTKQHNVRLFIHYSGVIDRAAVEYHPEWAALTPEGDLSPNGATSTFGPYVDELLIPQLKEVLHTYDLDGAWIDGECWGTVLDYSPHALAAWKAQTGLDNAPQGPDEGQWHEWLEFNRVQFERYLTRYLDVLHASKPGVEITSNWMYTGFAPRPVTAPIDFISGDYSALDSINTARFEARYISQTGMPWDLMAWGFSWRGSVEGMRERAYKPALQLQQEASIVLSQGGGFQVYYQPTRAGWFDDHLIEIVGQLSDFCRERQVVSHKTVSVPQVALLLSSFAFYDKTNGVLRAWEGEHNAVHGVLHALLESGYSVDILAEHQIAGKMAAYPVIVLPEVHTLEPDFRQRLCDYVKAGGSLVTVGAETARLFDYELGIALDGEAQDSVDFISAHGLLGRCPGQWQPIKPQKAKVIAHRYPTADTRKPGLPAATVFQFGKGKIAGIYGPLGTAHRTYHTPQLRGLLQQVVGAVFPDPLVTLMAPPCVDMALRKSEDKLLVHLTNIAGMQISDNYTIIDHIPAIGPVQVRIRLEKTPASIKLVPDDCVINFSTEDDAVVVTIPKLHIHNVLVVE